MKRFKLISLLVAAVFLITAGLAAAGTLESRLVSMKGCSDSPNRMKKGFGADWMSIPPAQSP